MTGDHAALPVYDPENWRDRFEFHDTLTRLIIGHLTRTQPFRPELVDGAWWLAKQLEETARESRAS